MTKIPPKPKNDQNTPEPKKMTKIPRNLKITKIPPKPKKMTKIPLKPIIQLSIRPNFNWVPN